MNDAARTEALELDGLGKDYGRFRALGALSLTVAPGEVYGLLGPNGAGKTTALRTVLGFLTPDRGRARVFGVDVREDPVAVRAMTGYLPGEVRLAPSPTGRELLDQLTMLRPPFDLAYRGELVYQHPVWLVAILAFPLSAGVRGVAARPPPRSAWWSRCSSSGSWRTWSLRSRGSAG